MKLRPAIPVGQPCGKSSRLAQARQSTPLTLTFLALVLALLAHPMAFADPPVAPPTEPSPAAVLEAAENDFRELQYRRAEQKLRTLFNPRIRLESPDDILRARELLGAALWYLDEKDKAQIEFERLLNKQSGHSLDKFVYPKPLLEFFEGVRRLLIEQGQIELPTEVPDEKPVTPSEMRVTIRESTRASAFMPFGLPQFEQDRTGWGVFFATSQGIAALGNLGSYIAYVSVYNGDDAAATEALFISTIATGAVWIALTAWGIIDANVTFEPVRDVRRERVVPVDQAMPTVLVPLVPGDR